MAVASSSGGTPPYTYAWSNGATNSSVSGLCAGTYNINVTDSKGCTSVDTVTITQPAALVVSIDSSGTASCTDTLWATVTGGTPGYTFSWSSGQTTDTITGVCPGTYTVTVTDKNGCNEMQVVTVTAPAGVMNLTNQEDIKLYPVPATSYLNVSIRQQGFDAQELMIYDITGRQLLNQRIIPNATLVPINVSGLTTGTYFIKVVGSTQQKMLRFTVINN
jgi:hypothetical protein